LTVCRSLTPRRVGAFRLNEAAVWPLQVDEASWLRGRGWALYQAVMALPYYWDTNPGMIRVTLNGRLVSR